MDASSAAGSKQTIGPKLARRGKKAFINPSASSSLSSSSTRQTRAGKKAEDADKGDVSIFMFFI